jgi:hypothetical protein
MAADAKPFLELMSDGFVWSDEKLHGLSVEDMGALRAVYRFRTSLITQIADSRFENIWNELRKACPEWIGFDPSRCSPNEELLSLYLKNKKMSPWALGRLQGRSSSGSPKETKRRSAAITLLLRARDAVGIPSGELGELDADLAKSIEGDLPEMALKTLEKIAEEVPCRGGFWRDLERAALVLEMKEKAEYFRSRFLSTKPIL